MKIDMHYYAVYVLARTAGLNRDTALNLAYASEYVDDSIRTEVKDHAGGARLVSETTAHHPSQGANLDREEQRQVWLPFHFLPGNEGTDFYQRLTCRKESALLNDTLEHHLEQSGAPWAVELVGVAAHVLADAHSHWGFSGVSSPYNCVHNHSLDFSVGSARAKDYLEEMKTSFEERFGNESEGITVFAGVAGSVAETATAGLGHAGALTYPDLPYLRWKFNYQNDPGNMEPRERDNPGCFIESTQKLHSLFSRFAAKRPNLTENAAQMEYEDIKPAVAAIIVTEGKPDDHCAMWQDLMAKLANDRNLVEAAGGEPAGKPIRKYQQKLWDGARDGFSGFARPADIVDQPVYRFYQAASFHRNYVLRELLPGYGLMLC
jgi:hypothetical protein